MYPALAHYLGAEMNAIIARPTIATPEAIEVDDDLREALEGLGYVE